MSIEPISAVHPQGMIIRSQLSPIGLSVGTKHPPLSSWIYNNVPEDKFARH